MYKSQGKKGLFDEDFIPKNAYHQWVIHENQ